MHVEKIKPRTDDGAVSAIVEIPMRSRNKYEYDPALDVIALDCTLYSAVHYPTDYGFVPGTKASDGDPIDVLVMVEETTVPGCLVRVRLIGVQTIEEEDGTHEPKLLAVPVNEPRFAQYRDSKDIPPHLPKEIEHFFAVCKELEGNTVTAGGWQGARHAEKALDAVMR